MKPHHYNKYNKIACLLILICCLAVKSNAQLLASKETETDLELWTGLDFTKEINKNVDLSFAVQTRLRENISIIRSNFAQIGLSFPLLKNSKKLNAATMLRVNRNESAAWTIRPIVDISYGIFKNNSVDIDYRTRIQNDYTSNQGESLNNYIFFDEFYWRNRLTIKYLSINDFTPFFGIALFKNVQQQFITPDQFRIITGFTYKVNKRHDIKITYIYREKFNTGNQSTNHIISAKYYFEIKDFKKKKKKKANKEKKLPTKTKQQPTNQTKKDINRSKPLGPHRIEP